MDKICPCGKKFYCIPALVERKKYCSKKCFYKYRKIPIWNKGLKGIHLSPSTEFKKGKHYSPKTEFKKGHGYKGDKVGYSGLHDWVERELGKPRMCEQCGTKSFKKYDWSNKSGTYKRDLSDWQRLCVKCHFYYDKQHFGARNNFHR